MRILKNEAHISTPQFYFKRLFIYLFIKYSELEIRQIEPSIHLFYCSGCIGIHRLQMELEAKLRQKSLQQQFRQDLHKHIKDIAEKYIIVNETADGAIMFIPAEAIFAEIHANYPDIISLSQRLKVWLVSPSTLMAVLTTAKAVLKDDATKRQVHIIQKHLHALADDFQRFEKRMDHLSKHIDQAQQDVNEVNTSAKKITQRFQKIESVDLGRDEAARLTE